MRNSSLRGNTDKWGINHPIETLRLFSFYRQIPLSASSLATTTAFHVLLSLILIVIPLDALYFELLTVSFNKLQTKKRNILQFRV